MRVDIGEFNFLSPSFSATLTASHFSAEVFWCKDWKTRCDSTKRKHHLPLAAVRRRFRMDWGRDENLEFSTRNDRFELLYLAAGIFVYWFAPF